MQNIFGDDDFNSDVGIKSSGEDFPDIDVRMSLTSSTVTGVMFESVFLMYCGSKVIGFGAAPFSKNRYARSNVPDLVYEIRGDEVTERLAFFVRFGVSRWRRVQ